jgi:hypothetical protein
VTNFVDDLDLLKRGTKHTEVREGFHGFLRLRFSMVLLVKHVAGY